MLKIGTDCSGIEAPIQALEQLGVSFEHLWSCEVDKFCRQSIEANYKPGVIYHDITTRDHSKLPDIDLYVAGFPCQSFSLMGNKQGTKDSRSNILSHCIKVIKLKSPSVFILENVKNFKFIEKCQPYTNLINFLENILDENGKQIYSVHSNIYNTKDYGIPQNRERLYIVGICSEILTDSFKRPEKIPVIPLVKFIQDKTKHKRILSNSLKKNIKEYNIGYKNYIITPFAHSSATFNLCPTLTTQCSKFYLNKYNRTITPYEALSLQGFSKNFKIVVSNTQIFKQVGNSMSVNVLKVILEQIFNCSLLREII